MANPKLETLVETILGLMVFGKTKYFKSLLFKLGFETNRPLNNNDVNYLIGVGELPNAIKEDGWKQKAVNFLFGRMI